MCISIQLLDYVMAPDTTIMADNVRGCLQESTDDSLMYSDYTHLFNQKLYSLNMKCVPKVLEAYETLKIKHESLRLIPPQFNSPLPPLQPAVSGICFRLEICFYKIKFEINRRYFLHHFETYQYQH